MAKNPTTQPFTTKAALEHEPATHVVWDTLQQGENARIHDVHGKRWALWHPNEKEEGTRMPLRYALAFLKDEAFIVKDQDGNELKAEAPQGDTYRNIHLPPNLVIANLSELTLDALMIRASGLPNGNMISRADGKERVIEFIMAAGLPEGVTKVGPSEPADAGEAEDDDGLVVSGEDADDADAIFGQAGAILPKPPLAQTTG